MKLFFIFLSLFGSFSAFSLELTCVHSIPRTSIIGAAEGDEFVLHLINHWGVRYMPLTTIPLSADDLEGVIKKARIFEKLGDHYIFRWKLKDCKRTDADLMSCSNGEELILNGLKVKPWGVYTKRIKTEIDIAEIEEIEVNLNLSVEGELQHLAVQYLKTECQQARKNDHWPRSFLENYRDSFRR
jgi:hypothetical protein